MDKNSFDGFLKFKDTKTFYNKSGRTQHMKRKKLINKKEFVSFVETLQMIFCLKKIASNM